jgi:3D (Asp-Asp-Asp) domain-containing protein
MKSFSMILAMFSLLLFTFPVGAQSSHQSPHHHKTHQTKSHHKTVHKKPRMKKVKIITRHLVHHGTKKISRGSNRLEFTMRATAYSAKGGITKSGTRFREGIIAVDPRVIPLGTKVYVEGYGEAIAEDTGGKIKGHRIDVAFNTHRKAINWGVKHVTVRILELP